MVYLLGMSHAINVVRALAATPWDVTHQNWNTFHNSTEFFPMATHPGILPGDEMLVQIVSQQDWGNLAEMRMLPNGQRQITPHPGFVQMLSTLEQAQDGGCMLSFLNGNEHAALSILQHPHPFDFVLPGAEDLGMQPGFQPIAADIVRTQLMPYMNSTIASLSMMRLALPRMRLIHALPPPPMASEAQIRRSPEVFRDQIDALGVTPFSIRRKYYLLANEILRQGVEGLGVEILPAPEGCTDERGGLLDAYAQGATHGNEAYGKLVAQQLYALLQSA